MKATDERTPLDELRFIRLSEYRWPELQEATVAGWCIQHPILSEHLCIVVDI
jgi:hypothetical protein